MPVIDQYSVGRAMEVVEIDHTLVDVFVVAAVNRHPLQRPWLAACQLLPGAREGT